MFGWNEELEMEHFYNGYNWKAGFAISYNLRLSLKKTVVNFTKI